MRSPGSDEVYVMRGDRDTFGLGRLSWIGLILAAIGWALLLAEAAAADIIPLKWTRALAPTYHGDLFEIAKCLIGSGFALAIVGALQSGFGALNRFFEAVLTRSGQRPAPQPLARDSSPEMAREHRPYRTFPDGSVEVETIVGTRRFESMMEAREFI